MPEPHNPPLYIGHETPLKAPRNSPHLGLWHTRFFSNYGTEAHDLKVPDKGAKEWFETFSNRSCGDPKMLERAATRQLALAASLDGCSSAFTSQWHFVTGMGLPHPLENGLAWHPVLGVPYLSGAAVKGLLRGWLEEWADDPDFSMERRNRWLGTADHPTPPERAGDLVFFDALPLQPPRLALDVMTPHMGKWYESGDQIEDVERGEDSPRLPGDFHSPNPVKFLVVQEVHFLVSVAPRVPSDESKKEAKLALEELRLALENLGAGAKTAAGYGLMKKADHPLLKQHREQIQRDSKSPLDKAIAKVVEEGKPVHKNSYTAILRAIELGTFQGEKARYAALAAKKIMESKGVWEPQNRRRLPSTPHLVTVKLLRWINARN